MKRSFLLLLLIPLCVGCSTTKTQDVFHLNNRLPKVADVEVTVNYDLETKTASLEVGDYQKALEQKVYWISDNKNRCGTVGQLRPGDKLDIYFQDENIDHSCVTYISFVENLRWRRNAGTNLVELYFEDIGHTVHMDDVSYVLNTDFSFFDLEEIDDKGYKYLCATYSRNDPRCEEYHDSYQHYFLKSIFTRIPDRRLKGGMDCIVLE